MDLSAIRSLDLLPGHLTFVMTMTNTFTQVFSQTLFKWDTLHDDNLCWALFFHATTDTDLV